MTISCSHVQPASYCACCAAHSCIQAVHKVSPVVQPPGSLGCLIGLHSTHSSTGITVSTQSQSKDMLMHCGGCNNSAFQPRSQHVLVCWPHHDAVEARENCLHELNQAQAHNRQVYTWLELCLAYRNYAEGAQALCNSLSKASKVMLSRGAADLQKPINLALDILICVGGALAP